MKDGYVNKSGVEIKRGSTLKERCELFAVKNGKTTKEVMALQSDEAKAEDKRNQDDYEKEHSRRNKAK